MPATLHPELIVYIRRALDRAFAPSISSSLNEARRHLNTPTATENKHQSKKGLSMQQEPSFRGTVPTPWESRYQTLKLSPWQLYRH